MCQLLTFLCRICQASRCTCGQARQQQRLQLQEEGVSILQLQQAVQRQQHRWQWAHRVLAACPGHQRSACRSGWSLQPPQQGELEQHLSRPKHYCSQHFGWPQASVSRSSLQLTEQEGSPGGMSGMNRAARKVMPAATQAHSWYRLFSDSTPPIVGPTCHASWHQLQRVICSTPADGPPETRTTMPMPMLTPM